MITSFLTGIADAYVDYDVVRTLKYGFSFDTQTLTEIMNNLFGWIFN